MDQSTYLQKRRYKVAAFGQQGTSASNRYLDRNGSFHTTTVIGRTLDDTNGYCCSPPTIPEPPLDLSANALSGPTARLSFTPGFDGKTEITNYLISYDGITYVPFSPPVTESPILIADLSYGTTYTFYLKTVNQVGESESSSSVTITIPNLPAAPTGLSGTPDPNSISVDFTAGNDGGSQILNYWYSLNGGPLTALSPVDAASPITIPGLTPSTEYTIYLAAENVMGVGASSSSITVTTLSPAVDPPILVLAVADASSAYIYYTAGTGDITNYEWSTDGTTFTPFSPDISSSPVRIPGLNNDEEVTVYLRSAILGGGTSAASNSLTVTPTGSATSLGPALYYDASGYSGSGPVQNSGSGGSSITGTVGTGVTYNASVASGIFDFTGIDSISFPQYNFGTAFTVCTWIYPRNATPGSNTINGIIANVGANQQPSGFKMGWNTWTTDDKSIYFEAGNDVSGGANFTVENIVTYNAWQHIAYVFDQANRRIIFFLNGIAIAMQTTISTEFDIGTNNSSFTIGTFVGGSYAMNAQLASLKVFGALLNATDIYNDYNTTKSRFGL